MSKNVKFPKLKSFAFKHRYVNFYRYSNFSTVMSKAQCHSKGTNLKTGGKSRSLESIFMNFRGRYPGPCSSFEGFMGYRPSPQNYYQNTPYWQSVMQYSQLCNNDTNSFQINAFSNQCQQWMSHSTKVLNRRHKDGRRHKSADGRPRNGLNEVANVCQLLSKRVWENVSESETTQSDFLFTVMSYNVLAQDLIKEHPELYRLHDPGALRWDVRWRNLYQEIKFHSPDIICLQEVQKSHIAKYYDQLKALGYSGLYKKRTGIRVDGCAIYYKTDVFNLDEYETVEFFQPNVAILNRDNVAIVAKFSPKKYPRKAFIVATTHLLYNPKRQDVRLAQMQLLLAEVERLSFDPTCESKNPYLPVILTGDLNSTPDSAVVSFVTKAFLNYEHLSSRSLIETTVNKQGKILVPPSLGITDNCQHYILLAKRKEKREITRCSEKALINLHNSENDISFVSSENRENPKFFGSGTIQHKFALKSVYKFGQCNNPEGTTFQNEWLTVDYIFYSENVKNQLKLLSRYRLPTKKDLKDITTPNALMGSDHLSLMAKFLLKV